MSERDNLINIFSNINDITNIYDNIFELFKKIEIKRKWIFFTKNIKQQNFIENLTKIVQLNQNHSKLLYIYKLKFFLKWKYKKFWKIFFKKLNFLKIEENYNLLIPKIEKNQKKELKNYWYQIFGNLLLNNYKINLIKNNENFLKFNLIEKIFFQWRNKFIKKLNIRKSRKIKWNLIIQNYLKLNKKLNLIKNFKNNYYLKKWNNFLPKYQIFNTLNNIKKFQKKFYLKNKWEIIFNNLLNLYYNNLYQNTISNFIYKNKWNLFFNNLLFKSKINLFNKTIYKFQLKIKYKNLFNNYYFYYKLFQCEKFKKKLDKKKLNYFKKNFLNEFLNKWKIKYLINKYSKKSLKNSFEKSFNLYQFSIDKYNKLQEFYNKEKIENQRFQLLSYFFKWKKLFLNLIDNSLSFPNFYFPFNYNINLNLNKLNELNK